MRPVGGLEGRKTDVRVIAATNRTIQDLRGGGIRQDLFYRLSVLIIQLPALRDRADDIPRLAQHFLGQAQQGMSSGLRRIAPDAMAALTGYLFPGNVRELENLMHNLCATLPPDRDEIRGEDVRAWFARQGIRPAAASPDAGPTLPLKLYDLETWTIRAALQRAGGNKSKAAALLGISRDSLYRKLHELGDLSGPRTTPVTHRHDMN